MPEKNAPASGFQFGVANLKPVEAEPRNRPRFSRRRQA